MVTIGNFFSLVGLLSIPLGLYLMHLGAQPVLKYAAFVYAIPVLALGRLCDLLDGWLADKTGTKSPLGEKIDASFDKISTGLIVIGLGHLQVVDCWILVLLILPHIVIAIIALLAYRRGQTMHVSRTGKISMAVAWICVFTFVTDYAFRMFSHYRQILALNELAFILLFISVAYGAANITGYLKEYRAFSPYSTGV